MAIVYLIRHTRPQNKPLVEFVPSAVLKHVCCVQHVFLMLEH
jgi:hypothetical protein